MEISSENSGYLIGKLLLAMPSMTDPRFHRAVILLCAHDANGAMGLVINHPAQDVKFADLLKQLKIASDIELGSSQVSLPVISGGPVEKGRGFILHGSNFAQKDTVKVDEQFSVTGTLDGLQAVANGQGPKPALFILGYAGWNAGQLDAELQQNAWLVSDPNPDLVFRTNPEDQWSLAVSSLGFDPGMLSGVAGRA